MKRSTFDPETIFGRSQSATDGKIDSWSIQIQSDEHSNWEKRRPCHELNLRNLVRLVSGLNRGSTLVRRTSSTQYETVRGIHQNGAEY